MKIKLPLIAVCLAVFLVGFSSKLPVPTEGVYDVKLRSFTFFDLMDLVKEKINYGSQNVELLDTKPDDLEVELSLDSLNEYKFGSLKLGNNEQKVWFLMVKDSHNLWSEVYIDQNYDNRIATSEKVRGLQNYDGKYKSFKTKNTFSMIPSSVRVSYKGSTSEIQKKLYYFFSISSYFKGSDSDTMAEVLTASFLDGEMKILSGKTVKMAKFRIIDANGNGCFNDYGTDLIFIDGDNDGYFKKKEGMVLREFYDYVSLDKQKKQLRMIIPPIPSKIAIVDALQDFDRAQLDAKSDPKDDDGN